MEKFRSRNFCLVLYPEDKTHADAILKLAQGYKYLGILHNRDVYDVDDTEDDDVIGTPKKNIGTLFSNSLKRVGILPLLKNSAFLKIIFKNVFHSMITLCICSMSNSPIKRSTTNPKHLVR